MDGINLGFKLTDFAKSKGLGIGSCRLKDGSSIKFLSKEEKSGNVFSHALKVKNNRLQEAYAVKGLENVAKLIDKYEKLAENPKDVMAAWHKSLDVIV